MLLGWEWPEIENASSLELFLPGKGEVGRGFTGPQDPPGLGRSSGRVEWIITVE